MGLESTPKDGLWLGTYADKWATLDQETIEGAKKNAADLVIQPGIFFRHAGIFGSTGSGKTVLGKIICEEAIRNGIPVIAIDPQGDIASLGLVGNKEELEREHGIPARVHDEYASRVDVRIFTPSSAKGVPISISPVNIPSKGLLTEDYDQEDMIKLLTNQAKVLVKVLIKIANLPNTWSSLAEAAVYTVLKHHYDEDQQIPTLMDLGKFLESERGTSIAGDFLSEWQQRKLVIALKTMNVGSTQLLFSAKNNINIDRLLAPTVRDDGSERIPVNVFFLKSLYSQEEKEFFISVLVNELYSWMIRQGQAKKPRCVFFCDEIAPFIPAGASKPGPKDALILLFRQARKYGIQCFIATQSPKDVDYHAYEQFNTFFIGRITSQQSLKVIERILEAFQDKNNQLGSSTSAISTFKSGEFLLVSPDNDVKIALMFTRWLISNHKTLTLDDVKKIMAGKYTEDLLEDRSRTKQTKVEIQTPSEPQGDNAASTIEETSTFDYTLDLLEKTTRAPEPEPPAPEPEPPALEPDQESQPREGETTGTPVKIADSDTVETTDETETRNAIEDLARLNDREFTSMLEQPVKRGEDADISDDFTNRLMMERIFARLGKMAKSEFGIEFLRDLVKKHALSNEKCKMMYFQEYKTAIKSKLASVEGERLVFDFKGLIHEIADEEGLGQPERDAISIPQLEAIFHKLLFTPGLKKKMKL